MGTNVEERSLISAALRKTKAELDVKLSESLSTTRKLQTVIHELDHDDLAGDMESWIETLKADHAEVILRCDLLGHELKRLVSFDDKSHESAD